MSIDIRKDQLKRLIEEYGHLNYSYGNIKEWFDPADNVMLESTKLHTKQLALLVTINDMIDSI